MLKEYVQKLKELKEPVKIPSEFESSIIEVMIQFQLKPMRKEFLKYYSLQSKNFTYKELRKISLKSCAYYSTITDSVFLLIYQPSPDEDTCVAQIIDIDDYKIFIDLRNDPSIKILADTEIKE